MQPPLVLRSLLCALSVAALGVAPRGAEAANPPVPAGPHPRLFMSDAQVAAYAANAQQSGTSAAQIVNRCQDTIDNPDPYKKRGGSDGDNWPGAAVACAFAYQATQKPAYLAQALTYWQAALDDDQDIGDRLGCVAGVATEWKSWDGNPPAPPVIRTVTHDTGYPIRWYGPYIALTYDWLYNAPGVTPALQAQTRTCLGTWIDYYTDRGYHHDEAGANYGAGYVAAIAVGSIAIGTDGGADGHLWTGALDEVFQKLLIGQGLAGSATGIGTPAGALLGGDWAEGWQYGPFAVLNYAAATRALEDHGAALPAMDAWVNSLSVRAVHGTLPTLDGQYVGGDFDSDQVYQGPEENLLDAVLLGPSTDQAAAWAAYLKQAQGLTGGDFIWNAVAELRAVPPADYRAQTPAPPLWYLARGTRTVYARTSWDDQAFWSVFSSAPQVVSDHHHFAASGFVFNRGGDGLVVDASNYGEFATRASNAVSADSPGLTGDYATTQTPWSEADLPWVRATSDAVYGARSDFAKGFNFASTPSDIPYAHREWVMLPEGEIVTIDRVHTADAAHVMYVQFHTHTGGSLALAGAVATGAAGTSKVAIHAARLSGGTPTIKQPTVGDCDLMCDYPCGSCDAARFPVDEYSLAVPGPWAVAIHVIDGLGASEAPAEVGSLNDDLLDPAPKQNTGVIGAAVYRGMKQSYVVASSAVDGVSGDTMTYGVPGASPGRHLVFDAPEAGDGSSAVTAAAQGDRCVITITQGNGSGFIGHPLMFSVTSASDGCQATASTDVAPGTPPGNGGAGGTGGSSAGGSSNGGTSNGGTSNGGSSAAGNGGTSAGGKSGTAGAGGSGTGGSAAGKSGAGGSTAGGTAGAGGKAGGVSGGGQHTGGVSGGGQHAGGGSGGGAGGSMAGEQPAADSSDGSGCGCSEAGAPRPAGSVGLVVGALGMLVRGRRRLRARRPGGR